MKLIFCLSYLSVPHTITLIKDSPDTNYLIVTSNKHIYTFMSKLFGEENAKLIPSFSYAFSSYKSLVFLPQRLLAIKRMKSLVWKDFKHFRNHNVYFFFNTAAYSHAWLIYKLSKNNAVYYQEDIDLSSFPIKKGALPGFSQLFIQYVYKEEVYPINQGKKLTSYKMRKAFLDKVKAQDLHINLDYRSIANWVNHKMALPQADVLLLNLLMDGQEKSIDVDKWVSLSDELLENLGSNGFSVHFKMHSRATKKYSLQEKLLEVPKYIPATFLLNYRAVIGYFSSTLFEAANNGLQAISLIDYLPIKDQLQKEQMKVYLTKNLKNNNSIHFPKTVEEVLDALRSLHLCKASQHKG